MKKVILHHTAVSRDKNSAQLIATDNYHKSLKFPKSQLGYYVGYHYLIEPDGTEHQTRKENENGAHTKQGNLNYTSIGICLTGNFDVEDPTEEQLETLKKRLAKIKMAYDGVEVEPHRKHAVNKDGIPYKTCCGNLFTDEMIDDLVPKSDEEMIQTLLKEQMDFNSALWVQMEKNQKNLHVLNQAFRDYFARKSESQ